MALRDKVAKYIPAVANRRALSRDEALSVVPVQNQGLAWSKLEDGEALLSIPRRADRLGNIIAKVFRVPPTREILLDEVGASVWELCDGKRNIGSIIAETSKRYKLNRREAEVSVTTYIKTLAERKLVGLVQRGGKQRHGRR